MPLSRRWAMQSRSRNRWLAPLLLRLPGFVRVHHLGRKSGRLYVTPLRLVPGVGADGGCVSGRVETVFVVMTYGPGSDWFQNLQANPGAVEVGGQRRTIEAARAVAVDAMPTLGRRSRFRATVLSVAGITELAELKLGQCRGLPDGSRLRRYI